MASPTPVPSILRAMQPLKYAKQFMRILHVKADSVVPDIIDLLFPFGSQPISTTAGFAPRVYLTALDIRFIQTCLSKVGSPWHGGSLPTCISIFLPFSHRLASRAPLAQFNYIHRPPAHRLPVQTRKGQQVVNQLSICWPIPDPLQKMPPSPAMRAIILQHYVGEPFTARNGAGDSCETE